jgi:DNA-binding SARP family transcriptional activator
MSIYGAERYFDDRAAEPDPIFGALGPLQVRSDDRFLHVGGPQIRTLLALLLARPGQVMSLSMLMASLWPGDAPPSAERTVRTYMSRLRQALAPVSRGVGSGQLVVAMPPGYLLRIDPESVDASRFEQLAFAGRRALIRNDLLAARASLCQALALWRGEAYAEFADVAVLRTEASRLEELRLNTVENRMQSELRLGLGSDLVAELDGLVAVHPLRERMWVQYMIALYRSGRQAEALSAYQRARTHLADELGLEPSSELADTHRKILAHDPTLLPRIAEQTVPEPASVTMSARYTGRAIEPAVRAGQRDRPDRAAVRAGSRGRDDRPGQLDPRAVPGKRAAYRDRRQEPATRNGGESPARAIAVGRSRPLPGSVGSHHLKHAGSAAAGFGEARLDGTGFEDAGFDDAGSREARFDDAGSPGPRFDEAAFDGASSGRASSGRASGNQEAGFARPGSGGGQVGAEPADRPGDADGWLGRLLRPVVAALVARLSRRSSVFSRWLIGLAALITVHVREWPS